MIPVYNIGIRTCCRVSTVKLLLRYRMQYTEGVPNIYPVLRLAIESRELKLNPSFFLKLNEIYR